MKIKQKLALIVMCLALLLLAVLAINTSQIISRASLGSQLIPESALQIESLDSQSANGQLQYLKRAEILSQLSQTYNQIQITFGQADSELIRSEEFSILANSYLVQLDNSWKALESSNTSLSSLERYRHLSSQKRLVENEVGSVIYRIKELQLPLKRAVADTDTAFYASIGSILVSVNQELDVSRREASQLAQAEALGNERVRELTQIFAIMGLLALAGLSWITLRNLIHPLRALVNLATGLVSQEEKGETREGAYKDYHAAVHRVGQYVEFQAGWQEQMKVTIAQYAQGKYAEVKMVDSGYYHPHYAPKNWVLPDEYVESMKVIEQLRGRLVNMHQEIQHLSNANLQREYNYRFSANDS